MNFDNSTQVRFNLNSQEILKLNSAVKLRDPHLPQYKNDLQLNFKPFLMGKECELDYFHKLLCTGQSEILLHPLCLHFLRLKWEKIKLYHIIRVIFNLIFVILLSLYVLSGHVSNCEKYDKFLKHEEQFPICKNSSLYGNAFRSIPVSLNYQWFVLLFFVAFEVLGKIYGMVMYPNTLEYISSSDNIFEWSIIFLFIIVSSVYEGQMFIWQTYLGGLMILLGWIHLMFLVGEFTFFHSYVDMYKQVIKRCLKLCILFGFPLFGCAICFCIIFPYSRSLSNLIQGLIIALTMMTGEINTDLIHESIPRIGFWIWAQIIFILFLFFITICNMNLVVAVLIGDLEKLEETALLCKVTRRTKLIWNLEKLLEFVSLQWLKKILVFPEDNFVVIIEKGNVSNKIWNALYEIAILNFNNKNTADENTHF